MSSPSTPLTFISTGVVTKVMINKIIIAFDQDINELIEESLTSSFSISTVPLRIDALADEITYKRYKNILENLKSHNSSCPASHLIEVLFSKCEPSSSSTCLPWKPFHKGLGYLYFFILQPRDIFKKNKKKE